MGTGPVTLYRGFWFIVIIIYYVIIVSISSPNRNRSRVVALVKLLARIEDAGQKLFIMLLLQSTQDEK